MPDSAEERLQQLGITLPPLRTPSGSYERVKVWDRLAFVSGTGSRAGGAAYYGKIGAGLTVEEGYHAARLAALMMLSNLRSALGSLDRIETFLRLQGFLNTVEGFTRHAEVLDGASDLITGVFGEGARPSRAAFGVHSLPHNYAVELEAVVLLKAGGHDSQ